MLSEQIFQKALRVPNVTGNGIRIATLLNSEIDCVVTGILGLLDVDGILIQSLPALYILSRICGPVSFLVACPPLGTCLHKITSLIAMI
jgi:hypothetical protein